ncbi:hypothetical protein [Streptomyces longispororuber]|uniref:hypothetical protein n=1 Tax=Streptomyces longispororuber TaxID=68230 RepID=UPI002109CC9C|nr:hypothetical protein [Streptomyces longispororuber]MCQ4214094.1 hypothetical protein [Streptomyces longispororuber]
MTRSADRPTDSDAHTDTDADTHPRTDTAAVTAADTAAVTVSLAAEAAVLEGRLSVLREAIDEVDAQIRAVSEKIRRLPRSVAGPGATGIPVCEGSDGGLAPSHTGCR